ncbi:hypothetical protein M8818_007711 [Zalaria obscura]|uniref:Uncharacterized protein n=1 Tax=Zalaria obscura TaxID=2024903 RepID=A0ACC3S2Z3_9PEZI
MTCSKLRKLHLRLPSYIPTTIPWADSLSDPNTSTHTAMASLPPRCASQRQPSPAEPSTSTTTEARISNSPTARSASSEDSQTVLLNAPSSQIQPSASPGPRPSDDLKKCWICFSDESEDTPTTSAWRDPCPCALVAHEDCLLDWIADMESPTSRKRTLGKPQILCPQCKSEIQLARPRSVVVDLVRAMERVAAKAVTPGALLVAFGTVVSACSAHGVYSINAVFGHEDARRILGPVINNYGIDIAGRGLAFHRQTWRQDLLRLADPFREYLSHWRLRIGLPLITPTLVLSRTHFVDSILPVLPIVFFATQGDADTPLDFGHWPPSASLAMAVLPYLRGAYNTYYDRVWAAREKQWLKEIQPRNGQNDSGNENADGEAEIVDDALRPQGDDNIFEIRVEGDIWDQWDAGEEQQEARQPPPQLIQEQQAAQREQEEIRRDMLNDGPVPQAHPFHAPPLDQAAGGAQEQGQQQQQQQQAPPPQPAQQQPQQNNGERRFSLSTTALAETILGALVFPTIASASGNLLQALLPRSWTTQKGPQSTGLLQAKWGRSLVGGCLFVVVKDAVMLYVRWKMAQQHRKRRVLDFDRKKKTARAG